MTSPPIFRRTVAVNGMQMYVEERGIGEPLLLLHGFTGSSADWRLVFRDPPEGYRLILPDLRGHGRSTNPSGAFMFRQSALDVFGLLEQLGLHRIQAIGISGGANTLLHMAVRQPSRLEAMVLVSAAHFFPESTRAVMDQMTAGRRTEQEWQAMRERHKRGDDQILALWAQARAFKDSRDDMNFTVSELSAITARTLIVHGDRDPLYPVAIPVALFGAIARSYLWIIPNAGHSPVFEETAGVFAETSLAFLRGEWTRG